MQRFLNPAVNDATTSPPPLPLSWWKHTREILTSTLKILSLYNSLVFTFSHLSGVWSMAGSWWLRLGRRYFPGLNEWKKKDLERNILTLDSSHPRRACFVWGTSLFSFAGQPLIFWKPLPSSLGQIVKEPIALQERICSFSTHQEEASCWSQVIC